MVICTDRCKLTFGGHKITNYREILRLKAQDFSGRSIALSLSCSRNTISKMLIAEALSPYWFS